MPCKPTRYPNGLEVGKCLVLVDGATVVGVDKIVEVSSDYAQEVADDIILCSGALEITLVSVSDSVKDVTIQADGGTVTFAANGSDTIQGGITNIVDGNSVRLVGKKSTNEWRVL